MTVGRPFMLAVGALAALGCGTGSSHQGVYTTEQANRGKDVYAGMCVSCHAGMGNHTAVQQAALVRGNAPGEWRYWGADAWSTRYSPLDQINASNFNSLQGRVAVERRRVRPDEYYRTTPLYANGRLFTVATTAQGVRHRSGHGQDALEVEARRGHPLAEGAAPVRRPRPRLLDRRPRTSASSSSRPAITWRRSTRRPASPIRSSARTASSISMDGPRASRWCRSRWTTPARSSSARRARAQGEAGREVGPRQEDRRRRHHGHRSRQRARSRELAGRSSSAT